MTHALPLYFTWVTMSRNIMGRSLFPPIKPLHSQAGLLELISAYPGWAGMREEKMNALVAWI